jgi:hypothetical protein
MTNGLNALSKKKRTRVRRVYQADIGKMVVLVAGLMILTSCTKATINIFPPKQQVRNKQTSVQSEKLNSTPTPKSSAENPLWTTLLFSDTQPTPNPTATVSH